jgi:hypothetical protein
MKQITPRMTGTEIQIEMEIQSLRERVRALEDVVRALVSAGDRPRTGEGQDA